MFRPSQPGPQQCMSCLAEKTALMRFRAILNPLSSFHIWGITPRETGVVLGDCRLISAMPFVNLKDASANYEVPYRHINVGHSIHAYDAKRAKRCRALPLRSPSS